MKRKLVFIIDILILIIVTMLFVFFCAPDSINNNEDKLQVIATIFPNYDFVKQIGKDKVDVKLLLKSGVESHTYEPSPKDMVDIENSDVFIYTGNEFEPWAENILESVSSKIEVVDTSKNITLINKEEFESHFENSEILEEEHEEHHEESSFDSHIWLNPENTIIMIDDILAKLCSVDPENSDFYTENAKKYKSEIEKLNDEIEQVIENAKRAEIAFAGEFSYSYFIDKYNLSFVSVYNNCGEGEDPSISKVKSVIDYINNHNLPVVFYEELSEGTVAKMIEEETSAKSMVFYTLHNANINKDSYVSLMRENLENLKEALN